MQKITLLYIIVVISAIFAQLSQVFATDKKSEYKLNKPLLIISFLILFIFIAFRNYGVGVDDYEYRKIFLDTMNNGPITEFLRTTLEPSYIMLNWMISLITTDFQYVIIITSFIILFFVYKALYYWRKKISLFFAIFLFGAMFYPYCFAIIRLSIAFSIVFYAYTAFLEGNIKNFNLLVLLAATIHYSALVILLLNFLSNRNLTKKNLIRFYIIALTVIPIAFMLVSKFLVPLLGARYAGYILRDGFHISISDFDKLPVIILCLFCFKYMNKTDPNTKIYLLLYSISIILSIYSSLVNFGRVQWYFNILICIIFPLLLRSISKSNVAIINLLLTIIVPIYAILYGNKIMNVNANILFIERYECVLFTHK